jgi:hypothetical protein
MCYAHLYPNYFHFDFLNIEENYFTVVFDLDTEIFGYITIH